MKKYRQFTALFLAVMLIMCLTACGGISDTDEEPENTTAGTQTEPADSYDTTVTYNEDTNVNGAIYNSTGTDENAIVITDGTVVLDNITVKRDSADSAGGDDSSFYGVGAAILAKGGTTTITNADIATDANGGAGVFAYGDGIVYISDSTIATTQDTSGGIHAAGGGTLYATNVTATTQGESSAAVRSDRGGGLMVVSGGSYTSNWTGSPAVYCTATIAIENAALRANASEAVCIEGLNSLYLYDCDLSGSMADLSQNDCTWNVILYQSMSGDSVVGNSTFQMTGGTLTAKNGGMFYTTNTESTFILRDVEIVYADDSEFFLRCTGNNNQRGWGQAGSNGADCTFTAIDQDMVGDVIWDSISQLDFYLTDGSTLNGAVVQDESFAGNGGSGYANLYIEAGSKWVITSDSVLTALYNAGTITDGSGNPVTVKGTDGTVYISGTSSYTITVSTYDTSVDVSGAGTITAFEDAQVNTGSQDAGGPGGGNMGGMPGDGQTPPDMPGGGQGNGGTPPDMPNGEQGSGEAPPDMPNGEQGNGEAPPDMPDGKPASGEAPPDMPNGEPGNGEAPPDMPNGGPGGGEAPPDKPDGNNR